MTALDLRKTPPRKAACNDGGVVYLGRTIDKVRATLPGGNLGEFVVGSAEVPSTMSLYLFRVMKTTEEEFRDVVARAAAEDDVVAWVRDKMPPEKTERWNAWIDGYRISDLPPETLTFFMRSNPKAARLPVDTRLVDALDYEDTALSSRAESREAP